MKLPSSKTIIIITGGPGTGKSHAAHALLSAIEGLTLLSYDAIKEKTWDRFGFDDQAEKDRLNRFSLEEFYLTLQKMMRDGKAILTEYPFNQSHREQLSALVSRYCYRAVTLLLEGDWKVIYDRGIRRDQNPNPACRRHPGHLTTCYHPENPGDCCNVIRTDSNLFTECDISSQKAAEHPELSSEIPGTHSILSGKNAGQDAILSYEEFRADIDRKNYDIRIGQTIRIDVTDYRSINYRKAVEQILNCIQ